MLDDILFFSFYTEDEYYEGCANRLRKTLDRLGARHRLEPFKKPAGAEWPDVCRKKIPFMYKIFKESNAKRIVWLDVDCSINRIPDFIADYTADIMAFRRGFPSSKRPAPQRARHWEPCFVVFDKSEKMEKFLAYAAELEASHPELKATDDYFFEEAWRKFKDSLKSYEIPGEMCSRHYKKTFNSFEAYSKYVFFHFGASGFVDQYKGKVIQHKKNENYFKKLIQKISKLLKKIKVRKTKAKAAQSQLEKIIQLARKKGPNAINSIEEVSLIKATENERELVKALFSYTDTEKNIPLHWFIRPAPGNMGDHLSPYIVHKATNLGIKYSSINKAKLFAIGSIGKLVQAGSYAWGTGISQADTPLNPNAHWLAVRGPYTRKAVLKNGGTCPEIFGDPGYLIKNFYTPKTMPQKGHFGLVRHYVHQQLPVALTENIDDINILVSTPEHIENFIDRLYACEAVLTSSLHVTILCHAYRIPCRLITFEGAENAVHGDGIKWKDYFEGAGMSLYDIKSIGSKLSEDDILNLAVDKYPTDSYCDGLMQSLHNALPNIII